MLEGYHLHLRSVQGSTAKSSGPDFHDALTNSFDFQWNVKALRKAGLISAKSTHFDVDILDRLYDTTEALGFHDKVMPGYVRTKFGVPTMKYGSQYGMMAAANTVEAANNVPSRSPTGDQATSAWTRAQDNSLLTKRLPFLFFLNRNARLRMRQRCRSRVSGVKHEVEVRLKYLYVLSPIEYLFLFV